VEESDAASLETYLKSFASPLRRDDIKTALVEGGVPLWQRILEYVPQPRGRGRALELGSPPFNISLLLRKFRDYEVTCTGAAADGRTEIVSELVSEAFGERHTFRCDCFDVEHDRFPYDDGTFDLVVFCEVIEHLVENPMHTLGEIHRVLKPGGAMVLSTPNVSRFDNLVAMARGRNIYDPYHLGSPFAGSRHLREYTYGELRELVAGCGFAIERMRDQDIYARRGPLHTAANELVNRMLARVTRGHYRFHLFVRARKTDSPFRWRFPPSIFAPGHLTMYARPRDPYAVVGENDALHFQMGWRDARTSGGRLARHTSGVGDVYLLCEAPVTSVTVTLAGGRGEIQTAHDRAASGEFVLLGIAPFDAPSGRWTDVAVPVNADFEPGNLLHVRIVAQGGVDVAAVRAR
jgi:SAM-dependent methyltransferase